MDDDALALDIGARAAACLARVEQAVAKAGRAPGDVKVLLATKTQPVSAIRQAVAELEKFELPVIIGENRVQEIVAKAPELAQLITTGKVDLHLIGPLQRNKINTVMANPVTVIESVDSPELAQSISERAARAQQQVDVMLQVNVSGEATKSGCDPAVALDIAQQIAKLPGLRLIGFMCIGLPPKYKYQADNSGNVHDDMTNSGNGYQHSDMTNSSITNAAEITLGYQKLRQIRDAAIALGLTDAKELSMGMSEDLELAIAAGATIVRIGTAIFGTRFYGGQVQ